VIGGVVTVGIICYALFKCFKKKPKDEQIEKAYETLLRSKQVDQTSIPNSINDSHSEIQNTFEEENLQLI
jgi:hypothetical protein